MQLTFHCLIKKTYNPTHIVTIEIITTYEEFTGYPAKLIFTYFPNNLSIFKRLMILIYLNGDNKLLSGIYLCIILCRTENSYKGDYLCTTFHAIAYCNHQHRYYHKHHKLKAEYYSHKLCHCNTIQTPLIFGD